MKKKFKVRLKPYKNWYHIQYCNYYIIPYWYNIRFFYSTNNFDIESRYLCLYKDKALDLAKTFNHITDIKHYEQIKYLQVKDKLTPKVIMVKQ